MKYRVHCLDFGARDDRDKLEQFLNNLEGELVAIIPNFKKTTLAQIYGVAGKVDFLLIVEKTI
jgi:hypothetical protein